MATNKYTTVSLAWAKEQLESWKAYIDANPFSGMKDRIKMKETKGGGMMPVVIATIEAQQKNSRDMMKEYLALLEIVKRLEQDSEDEGPAAYGGTKVSPRMKNYDDKSDKE